MEEIRHAYGTMAERYIELFGSSAQVHPDDLKIITKHLCVPGSVLDVGCGPGHLTEHLRVLNVDAIGIDIVPEFIKHARAAYPDGKYELGSMFKLPAVDHSVGGILAWYSLIHLLPDDLDEVLAELRRVMEPGATLVVGFFDGRELATFDHAVTVAYYWPVDELSARLQRAGFTEIARQQRPGVQEQGRRPQAAIVAKAD
jgi:ubiquinone/menaquinone biosynthesis C-methylase UbiE